MRAEPFTASNAASMGRIGGIASGFSRKRARLERLAILSASKPSEELTDDEARRKRTLRQIQCLDKLIDKSLERDDEESFVKLAAAKEKLWKLVQPTAGVNRPGRQSKRNAEAQPIETPQQSPDPAPADTTIPARDMSQEM
jgi:hypothetical protein